MASLKQGMYQFLLSYHPQVDRSWTKSTWKSGQGADSLRQPIMHDYNYKSNENQVKGTVPTGRIGSSLSAWSGREIKAWILHCLTQTSCLAQGPIYLLPPKLILSFWVLSRVLLFAILWTVAHQVPLAMGFSKQEYWSWLPFPSPGDLPDPGIKPPSLSSPALASIFFTTPSPEKLFQMGTSNNRGE